MICGIIVPAKNALWTTCAVAVGCAINISFVRVTDDPLEALAQPTSSAWCITAVAQTDCYTTRLANKRISSILAQLAGSIAAASAGPIGLAIIPALAAFGAWVGERLGNESESSVVAEVLGHLFGHMSGGERADLLSSVTRRDHDLEIAIAVAIQTALQKAHNQIAPEGRILTERFDDWFSLWERRLNRALRNPSDAASLLASEQSNSITLAFTGDSDWWPSVRPVLVRWAREESSVTFTDWNEIPQPLDEFLEKNLLQLTREALQELLKEPSYQKAWIGWQQRFLEAIAQRTRLTDSDVAQRFDALANDVGDLRAYVRDEFTKVHERLRLVNQLRDRLRRGGCVLFAGSGLSAQAGFPTWNELARIVAARFDRDPDSSTVDAALAAGDADSVIYSISRDYPAELRAYLRELFGAEKILPEAHRILADLHFAGAITSNWDKLLEQTFPDAPVFLPQAAQQLQSSQLKGQFFLLKVYGDPELSDSFILGPSEFDWLVAENSPFISFMRGLLLQQTVVFVGCSLEGIENFLRSFRLSQPAGQHFALTGVNSAAWRSRARLLSDRYSLVTIPYDNAEGLLEILKGLKPRAAPAGQDQRSVTTGREPARLQRATFENIGPFERLEIDFASNWTILLGNNGVGKSSILRALAVAACGSDAAPWADRLIRVGHQNATITLHTDKGQYLTTISKKLGGNGAEIETLPLRVMEAEGWLVLGFPPLRSGSWNVANIQADDASIPVSDDVLPLIRGEADPRLDSLKQWIVSLDYRAKDAQSRGVPADTFGRLLTEFFRLVGHLTEGVELAFGNVDASTHQVTVITHDGQVPIEQVSQGTISLISWVGVLLQRLFEVYGTEESMRHHALVLMDEIDAHMHPLWQQRLIPRLKAQFPNVQFVVTTHSPLVVAGRSHKEVLVFERDSRTRKVSMTRPLIDFDGLRSDQILMSSAFGLLGVRDIETVEKQKRYGDLLNQSARTPSEEDELIALRLDPAISSRRVEENPRLQEASELVRASIQKQLSEMPLDEGRRLAAEADDELKKILGDFPL